MNNRQPIAVCCGVGVDSTAMLIGMERRGIRPDLITFADTGGEKNDTYLYVPILQQWLRDVDFPQLQVCRYNAKRSSYDNLYDNCWNNQTLPSLAFGMKSCSMKWKRDAQEPLRKRFPAFIRSWAEGKKIVKCIGFDASEKRRTFAGAGKESDEYQMCYPLQDWGWDRQRCKEEIFIAGLPIPIKSACFFCPAMTKGEIEELRLLDPEQYAMAVALEERYLAGKHYTGRKEQGLPVSTQGLGRRFAWGSLPIVE